MITETSKDCIESSESKNYNIVYYSPSPKYPLFLFCCPCTVIGCSWTGLKEVNSNQSVQGDKNRETGYYLQFLQIIY